MKAAVFDHDIRREIGHCIYCGSDGDGILTDEHVIPQSLNGTVVLDRASCKPCEILINKEIENPNTSRAFKAYRAVREYKSKSGHPEKLPLTVRRNGGVQTVMVDVAEHPGAVTLPHLPPPGLLVGNAPETPLGEVNLLTWYSNETQATLDALGAQSIINSGMDMRAFARFLAKTAHGLCVARFGDGFLPILPDFIRDKRRDIFHVVGALPKRYPASMSGSLAYEWGMRSYYRGGVPLIVVNLRPFAEVGAEFNGLGAPTYLVVAGELKIANAFLADDTFDSWSRAHPDARSPGVARLRAQSVNPFNAVSLTEVTATEGHEGDPLVVKS